MGSLIAAVNSYVKGCNASDTKRKRGTKTNFSTTAIKLLFGFQLNA